MKREPKVSDSFLMSRNTWIGFVLDNSLLLAILLLGINKVGLSQSEADSDPGGSLGRTLAPPLILHFLLCSEGVCSSQTNVVQSEDK